MPFCSVPPRIHRNGKHGSIVESEAVELYYRTYGRGDCKVMMIMGVAATNNAWWPQIKPLAGTEVPNELDGQEEELSNGFGEATSADYEANSNSSENLREDFGEGLTQAIGVSSSGCSETASSWSAALDAASTGQPLFDRLAPSGAEAREGHSGAAGRSATPGEEGLTGRVVCVFDNRGVGKSSHPRHPKNYRTEIMAADVLAVADELKWDRFHVIGHSMGGMIACKVASAAPSRVLSLALISTSTGGFDILPRFELKVFRMMSRFMKAKTPHARADVDLDMHFSERFLSEIVDGLPRRQHLLQEYVRTLSKKGSMQPKHAEDGQISACWNHGLTSEDVRHICHANIPTTVIHGTEDVVAHVSLGRRVARRLRSVARLVELHGGHMILRERVDEVNRSLLQLLSAAQEGISGRDWAASDEADDKLRSCVFSESCGCCATCVAAEIVAA